MLLVNKSFGDTKRGYVVQSQIQTQSECPGQLHRIAELQGYFESLVGLRLPLTVCLMHQAYIMKKSQQKPGILLKIDSEDDTFDANKPGNFNS